MKDTLISIIIPTYKEAENISILVEKIDLELKQADINYELIIIDDNSKDGILEIINKLKNKFSIKLKIRRGIRGLSSAVIDGFKIAEGEVFVVMDADNSHPPEKIPALVIPILNNKFEFVLGSRFIEGGNIIGFNLFRKFNAFISRIFAQAFTKIKDPMSGFFAFPKKILQDINILNPLGFKIGLEIIVKCNPKNILEIPIEFKERLFGYSKLSIKEQLLYLLHVKRLFSYKFKHLYQIISYILVGSLGMIIDLFFVFIGYQILLFPFKIARVFGFIFSLTFNFFLNGIITFPNSIKKNFLFQYIFYFFICIIGFFINWLISIYLFENYYFFYKYYLFASFIGIISGFCINFLGSKLIVYKKAKKQ